MKFSETEEGKKLMKTLDFHTTMTAGFENCITILDLAFEAGQKDLLEWVENTIVNPVFDAVGDSVFNDEAYFSGEQMTKLYRKTKEKIEAKKKELGVE